jgi:hypothetical protein
LDESDPKTFTHRNPTSSALFPDLNAQPQLRKNREFPGSPHAVSLPSIGENEENLRIMSHDRRR